MYWNTIMPMSKRARLNYEQAKLEKQRMKEREEEIDDFWEDASVFYDELEYRKYAEGGGNVPENAFYELSYKTHRYSGSSDDSDLDEVLLTETEVQQWMDTNYLHWQGIKLGEDGKGIRIIDDVHYSGMRECIGIRDIRIPPPKFDTTPAIVQLCKEVEEAEKAAIETEKQRKKDERIAKKANKEKEDYERLKAKFEEAQ